MRRPRLQTLLVAVATGVLASAGVATADWDNSRGGPERDGVRSGVAFLPQAQVSWRHSLGGSLSTADLWTISDPGVPRIALANGGRLLAKRWDDSASWRGNAFGVTDIVGEADLDNDGEVDLIFAASTGTESFVIGYTPDGIAAFTTPPGLFGRIINGVRIVDLDGDGIKDLYVTPAVAGSNGAVVAAFRFPGGAGSGELMYTIDPGHRDYFGGFYDVVAELDGTPGLEILAMGRNEIYVYDAATGALESESTLSGPVPFARATLRLVDIDFDGKQEVFAFSNQQWSAPNNRRYVSLWSHDGARMTESWTRDVADVTSDQISFSDTSVVDLAPGGGLEVVFGVYDAAAGAWSTEIRDAASGNLLATVPGERFEDVALTPSGPILFTHDDASPLRAYRYTRPGGVVAVTSTRDLSLVSCRVQRSVVRETLHHRPCAVPVAGENRRGVIAAETDANGRRTAIVVLDTSSTTLAEIARFDARGGTISAAMEIPPGHPAVIAVAHSDGVILPLDEQLRFLAPSPKPPFSWAGVRYGSMFSGTDVVPFPLVVPRGDGQPEAIVALIGGGQAALIDASNEPTVVGGAEVMWTQGSATRLLVDTSSDPARVVLVDTTNGLSGHDATDGAELWRLDDMFNGSRNLHSDPLLVPADDGAQIWFHRRVDGGGYDLTALDISSGQVVMADPQLDVNDGGWKRLALSTWGNGEVSPLSGVLSEVWRFDLGGNVLETFSTPAATSMIIPVPRVGTNPMLLGVGTRMLSGIDPDLGTTIWTRDHVNGSAPRLGALLNVSGRQLYATADAITPAFRVIDVETGALDFETHLVAGQAVSVSAPLPVPVPLLHNVTAITDLTGSGQPAYLVGSTDGFIYAISALDYSLVWSLFTGSPVSEIVPVDWDGDGLLELVASSADGELLGIDTFTGASPEWVIDTDGIALGTDVDELATRDTLYAAWAPVEGATGYEVAVFTNDRQPVTQGFATVGNTTQTTLGNLDLEPGTRYVVSVRAVSALGQSADRPSDGVTVLVSTTVAQGCCDVSGRGGLGGGLEALLLAGLCLVLTRRRRR